MRIKWTAQEPAVDAYYDIVAQGKIQQSECLLMVDEDTEHLSTVAILANGEADNPSASEKNCQIPMNNEVLQILQHKKDWALAAGSTVGRKRAEEAVLAEAVERVGREKMWIFWSVN